MNDPELLDQTEFNALSVSDKWRLYRDASEQVKSLTTKGERLCCVVGNLMIVLHWYADPKNWKDSVDVWGWGQGQHHAIVAPAKLDQGTRAKDVLDSFESIEDLDE